MLNHPIPPLILETIHQILLLSRRRENQIVYSQVVRFPRSSISECLSVVLAWRSVMIFGEYNLFFSSLSGEYARKGLEESLNLFFGCDRMENRFPELHTILTRLGAKTLLIPSAFTLKTGKDHWCEFYVMGRVEVVKEMY
jgi:hypothetical protein